MHHSKRITQAARQLLPGGVNSPVRSFKYVGGTPPIFSSGKGAYITDVDGKRYIDYVGAYGPMIVGHAHPAVVTAVQDAVSLGFHFGASHALELEMAQMIMPHFPSMDKIRLVSSGTEACMSALRLARAASGKQKIIKFAGCYHGHSDALLVNAGSGALSCGQPSSPGVLADYAQHTLTATYNDLSSVEALLHAYVGDVAAIIVEPIAGNMGCIMPQVGFLSGLRRLCDEHGVLLLFDEVMTGFRVGLGGCTTRFNVQPDLLMLGKVIGGGLPIGALLGPARYMDQLAPDGPVYQAGTLSGSPIALSAGIATLKIVQEPGFYTVLSDMSRLLTEGISAAFSEHDLSIQSAYAGGMFGFAFTEKQITCLPAFNEQEQRLFIQFFHEMLAAGVYFAPSPYEAAFISRAHTKDDIAATIAHARSTLAGIFSCH